MEEPQNIDPRMLVAVCGTVFSIRLLSSSKTYVERGQRTLRVDRLSGNHPDPYLRPQ